MLTVRDVVAGHIAVNAWELEERRARLSRMSVEESVRQYLEMWDLARQISPDAEAIFSDQRAAHYKMLHRRMEKAALVMGRVDQN